MNLSPEMKDLLSITFNLMVGFIIFFTFFNVHKSQMEKMRSYGGNEIYVLAYDFISIVIASIIASFILSIASTLFGVDAKEIIARIYN